MPFFMVCLAHAKLLIWGISGTQFQQQGVTCFLGRKLPVWELDSTHGKEHLCIPLNKMSLQFKK